jgi:DNA-directed RNA polymerase subunit RPC12/RpoP
MESKYEVKPVGVEYTCDKCGKGTMNPTGLIAPSQPPKYEHICSECGERALLDKQYPHIIFDRLENVPA